MILQADNETFPGPSDRALFLVGLALYIFGQVLINLGQDFVEAQRPIDFAHWLLIAGVLFLVPFAARLPHRNIHLLTLPLLLAGIMFVIGMCVLDLVFWSLPDGDLERDIANHLVGTGAIWDPFMIYGSNHIFNAGLLLPSLSYFRKSPVGTGLVVLGTLVIVLGVQWFNVVGYVLVAAGYALNFRPLRRGG